MPHGEHKHEIETIPALKDLSGKEMGWQNITGRKGRMREALYEVVWRQCRGPRGPEIAENHDSCPKTANWRTNFGSQEQATHRQVWGDVSANIFMEEIEFAISAWDNIWLKSLTNLSHSFPFPVTVFHYLKFTSADNMLTFCHMFVDVRHC